MVSIMRDRYGITNSKAKLTINKLKPDQLNLNRIYKYIYSNSEDIKLNEKVIGKMLELIGFDDVVYLGIDVDVASKGEEDLIAREVREGSDKPCYVYSVTETKIKKVNDNLKVDKEKTLIFVNLDGMMKKNHAGSRLRFRGIVFKRELEAYYFRVINIDKLYAIIKIQQSPTFKKLFNKNVNGTDDKFLRTINIFWVIQESNYKGKGYISNEIKEVLNMMLRTVELDYRRELNYKLMEEYENGRKSDYAKVFQTKKNINKKILEEMKVSPYLKYFKFVELDNDVDIEKYKATFKYLEELTKTITFPVKKNELRFRKLGNLRATGVYFPFAKCISIDIRDVGSFLHEVAHSIDYEVGGSSPLSLEDDFQDIIEYYSERFSKFASGIAMPSYKINYYLTPTEIFARGFELAYLLKGRDNVLVGDKSKFNKPEYAAFKGIEDDIIKYYSKFIK